MATAQQTYRGNCHCGAYVYEAKLPQMTSVYECNCSICRKKGYLWVFVGVGDELRVVEGSDDALASYSFGPGQVAHKFCATCATPLIGVSEDAPPGMQRFLNVHAIQRLDTWKLERVPLDGAALGSAYVPREYTGSVPAAATGEQLYTGGCHCGKVGVAVVSEALDGDYDDRVTECNCSICERNAYRWIYPRAAAVVLAGGEADIGRYAFSQRWLNKTFCRSCGVCFTNERNAAQADDDAPEAIKTWIETYRPLNLRVLDGVDLSVMKAVQKFDGATMLHPPYENP